MGSFEDMSAMVTDVSVSTVSILVVAVTPVVNITTVSTSTSTILYFGKLGMRHLHIRKNQHHMPAVNLDKLWTLVSEQTKEKYKNHPEKKVPVIDCVRAGFYKVL